MVKLWKSQLPVFFFFNLTVDFTFLQYSYNCHDSVLYKTEQNAKKIKKHELFNICIPSFNVQ